MKRLFLLLLIFVKPLFAVEVQPGQLYSGGTDIQLSALGISFTIPDGWRGGWPAGSSAFVLDNDAGNASIMMVFDAFTEQQIVTMMAENIPLDEGIYLLPSKSPEKKASYFENHYQVMGSVTQLNAFIAAKVLKPGLSLATIIMSASISESQQSEVVALTTGLTLFEPQVDEENSQRMM